MGHPIKQLIDEYNEPFLPFTNSQSIGTSGGKVLQEVLDVKLDPADVKAGSNIKVTPDTDNTTIDWVRPTNLTVQNNVTTTSSGKGVLDAYQGKILNDKFANYIPTSQRGVANGVATLDDRGIVHSAQLPAYVDDVIEAYIRSGQTALSSGWLSATNGGSALTPETGKIYVIMTAGDYQNKQYRWGGSTYVLCNPSDVNSVNGMTGVITLKTLTLKTAAGSANTVNETYNAGTDKTVTINVPSKTSHITNDSGFITSAADITGNAATATTADKTKGTLTIKMKNYDNNTETTDTFNGNTDKTITIGVPTKVSQLDNDSQFITSSASITGNAATATTATTATKTQGTLTIKMKNYDTNTETTDTFNGYADKTITIGVPTKLSQLNNDTGFITSVPQASTTVSGTIKIGTGLAMGTNGAVYVTGEGVSAQSIDWENVTNKPTYITDWKDYITADSDITGNANTATTLQTARTINGTSFNGSQNITTANWGTARNISISDSDATNTGTTVSVNGSKAVTLKLPAIIKASLSGNATTATTLQTARTINGVSFDGSKNITITANPTSNGLTNQDLNTVTTPGFYYGGGSNSVTNKPSNVDAFGLIVYKTASGYTTQDLIEGNTTAGKRWTRQYTGSTWSAWGNIYTSFAPQTSITGNAATATTLETARTLTIGSTGKTFNGGANVSWTLAEIGAAAASHTHNYAGSSSAGGAANSVKTNLIIKLNGGTTEGTNLFTFNGSTAKTVNITASGIGAAASSHTHNYAGSSSAGGAANSTKASLTLTKNRSDVSFNGSAAQTVTIPTVHTGPGVPAASLGQDGDIYIVTG